MLGFAKIIERELASIEAERDKWRKLADGLAVSLHNEDLYWTGKSAALDAYEAAKKGTA